MLRSSWYCAFATRMISSGSISSVFLITTLLQLFRCLLKPDDCTKDLSHRKQRYCFSWLCDLLWSERADWLLKNFPQLSLEQVKTLSVKCSKEWRRRSSRIVNDWWHSVHTNASFFLLRWILLSCSRCIFLVENFLGQNKHENFWSLTCLASICRLSSTILGKDFPQYSHVLGKRWPLRWSFRIFVVVTLELQTLHCRIVNFRWISIWLEI